MALQAIRFTSGTLSQASCTRRLDTVPWRQPFQSYSLSRALMIFSVSRLENPALGNQDTAKPSRRSARAISNVSGETLFSAE